MGLKPKHHRELNRTGISKQRLAALRREYAGDKVALQQIDVYDGSSEYSRKFGGYLKALKQADEQKERKLARWFKRHYPDIGR